MSSQLGTHATRAARTTNRLLDALSPWAYSAIQGQMQRRPLAAGQSLYAVQGTTTEVVFPTSAIASLALDAGGHATGVAFIGGEGGLGVWLALGLGRSPWEAVVRAGGEALVLPAELFRTLLRDEPDFREHMLAYSRTLFDLSSRAVACSQVHDRRARLARWILEADGHASNGLITTMDLLSAMTGESIEAAEHLLAAHVEADTLERPPTGIRILERPSLLAAACPCYAGS